MRFLAAFVITLCMTVSGAIAGESRTAVLDLQNLQCYGCVLTVKKALQKTAGVEAVAIDLDKKTATVRFDATKTDPAKLTKATAEAGFPSTVKE